MTDSDTPGSGGAERRLSLLTNLVATGFFSGYVPWASGTAGSMVGVLLYLIPGAENPPVLLVLIVLGFAAGVFTSGRVAAVEGNRLSATARATKELFQPGAHEVPDPSIVVIDEIVGMWIALFMVPHAVIGIGSAFVFFRIFDIVKPPPARQLERLPRGWGIMLDDVVAGMYANILTQLLSIFIH